MQTQNEIEIPPHSSEAEQAVLGGLILDNDAWSDVGVMLEERDFFSMEHQYIFRAIASLSEKKEPFDFVTLADELDNQGKLDDAGGMSYLTTLATETPSASNIKAYANIVRERAARRRLILGAREMSALAFHHDISVDEMREKSKKVIDEALGKSLHDGEVVKVSSYLSAVVDMADRAQHEEDAVTGLQTGFIDIDKILVNRIQPDDLVVIAGRPSMGKAQPLDSMVLTTSGWKEMGEIRTGDALASIDGAESTVVAVHPRGERQVYRIIFSDGRSAEACSDHLWRVNYREWEEPRVLSTDELVKKLSSKRYRNRLWIETFSGEYGTDEGLPVDPWLLGVLLGDGSMMRSVLFTTADSQIVDRVEKTIGDDLTVHAHRRYAYSIVQYDMGRRKGHNRCCPNPLKVALESLGVWGHKHEEKFIPRRYFFATRAARAALLAGLIDTDGWVETFGSLRFCTVSERLASDVVELARSLGATASYTGKSTVFTGSDGLKKAGLPSFVCNIQHEKARDFVWLERKRNRIREKRSRIRRLNIVDIQPSRIAETRCITVSHPTGLYVTDNYTVTHNSVMGMNLIENFLKNDDELGCAVAFTLEMSSKQLALRMVSGRSAVSINRFADGSLKQEDWQRITKAVSDIDGLPLYLDDSPVQTIHSIRSKVLKIANREPVKAVLVDYLQLMSFANGRKDDGRSALIGDISRGLKTLAKEVQAPVIALSQLNRALEGRNNKRPRMWDLRDSGSIEQDADIIAMLYRDEVYNDSVPQTKGVAEVNIVKNRNGPIGQAALVFQGEYTRFVNGDQSTIGRYWGGIHRRNPRAELDDE